MRKKILLSGLFLLNFYFMIAQDTIRSLVITEARITNQPFVYIELTNMGDSTLDLHNWEFGRLSSHWTDTYGPDDDSWIMLGDYIHKYVPSMDTLLEPGESFWMTLVYDRQHEQHLAHPGLFEDAPTMPEQWNADIVFHAPESPSDPADSISVNWKVMEIVNQIIIWYTRYHLPNGDSVFTDMIGEQQNPGSSMSPRTDVAGVQDAVYNSILVRKNNIKEGNIDFKTGRGFTAEDSEWIPVPLPRHWTTNTAGKHMYWTLGNHGDYKVDESTLSSSTIHIDWDRHMLNVPWGVLRGDSLMMQFDYHPGLAWNYKLHTANMGESGWAQAYHDSSFTTVRTGDSLIVWAVGNTLDEAGFDINVLPPPANETRVFSKARPDYSNHSWYGNWSEPYFEVTDGVPGGDTIHNIPFALRKDSVLKFLEKAPDASWEFINVDGIDRPDLKYGDLLRIEAEDGSVKDYFLDVMNYMPDHNAALSAITWPDIPVYYKNVYGFKGDTIPGFSPELNSFKLLIPHDVEGFPALVAIPQNINTRIEVKRATYLYGTMEERSVTFTSYAEDETSVMAYKVELIKELTGCSQRWEPEPFLSQYVFQDQWANNFMEICNPGTEALDLSNYMIINSWGKDPYEIIRENSGKWDWKYRYTKYIPGYKWLSESEWGAKPGICEPDPLTVPSVAPGDVFVMGAINSNDISDAFYGDDWWVLSELDVNFANQDKKYPNKWGEEILTGNIGSVWSTGSWYMFKILNDSVKLGLKAANDPDDFKLIEAWASPEEGDWIVGGRTANADGQTVTWIRKPEYYKGKTGLAESFGTQVDNGTRIQDGSSEWLCYDKTYGSEQGYEWGEDILYITRDLGQHSMNEVTAYKSTVHSRVYIVSQGYSMDERIQYVINGTTVADFLENIIKEDEEQNLRIVSDGAEIETEDVLTYGDSLYVVSADSTNTSRYLIEVTDEEFPHQALLTSSVYTILVDGETGSISGFDYGTSLKTIREGVALPSGASMVILDDNGAYVPFQQRNFDGVYVLTQVSDRIYFAVTSEDGVVTISYQLKPNSSSSDACLYSDLYYVDQQTQSIQGVAEGTSVSTLYSNLITSAGASMQLKDKAGFNRDSGTVYRDDKIHVIAEDGETNKTYYIMTLSTSGCDVWTYILSDFFLIDQITRIISDGPIPIISELTVNEFFDSIRISPDAEIFMLDANANIKDSNDQIGQDDIVKVTACDGKVESYYYFNGDIWESVELQSTRISVYPNPSAGLIRIDGLEIGDHIRVFNTLGAEVVNKKAENIEESISLENQGKGFYFLTVSNDKNVKGYFKVIVE